MQDTALTGPLVVVAVLVAATAFGLWRRHRDGRLRPVLAQPAGHPGTARAPSADVSGTVAPGTAHSTGHLAVAHRTDKTAATTATSLLEAVADPAETATATGTTATAATATAATAIVTAGAGEDQRRPGERPVEDPGAPGVTVDPGLLTALGVQLGTPATLLQFSSAFCAPCRATRRVLNEVTGLLDGVRHVEIDAESHLAAVRALNIWRTPTVLVVDSAGRIVARATGVPAKPQVVATLAPLLTAAANTAVEPGRADREPGRADREPGRADTGPDREGAGR
ncbi:thioredoxin family protein [Micromonospora sp. NBC_01699]|uniref:TlpA family protein disulfide reductase n=1 Tax=Micromonospora sp. NBC_01699 TaxID=2975984 RepID=UPI002E2D670D|nr:thioredoxin family protein [Micromonospora sp. NBC_01699]